MVQDGIDGTVPGFLHVPQNYQRDGSEGHENTAAILLSGAGGGVVGPSSIYLSMGDKLAHLRNGIPVLRMDYRFPARNEYSPERLWYLSLRVGRLELRRRASIHCWRGRQNRWMCHCRQPDC